MSESSSYRQVLQGRLQAQRALISELIRPQASHSETSRAHTAAGANGAHGEFPRSVLMRTVLRHPTSLAAGLLGLLVLGPRRVLRTAAWALPLVRTQSALIAQIARFVPLGPLAGRAFGSWMSGRRAASPRR